MVFHDIFEYIYTPHLSLIYCFDSPLVIVYVEKKVGRYRQALKSVVLKLDAIYLVLYLSDQ